jgi:glycosyltransferase involved in cell wall biosynthesis
VASDQLDQTTIEPGIEEQNRGVALVHDYLVFLRGAERTFAAIAGLWPDAPIYTVAYSNRATEGRFAGREIHSSWLRWLRPRRPTLPFLLPLYRRAVEGLDLAGHPLVVSSSFSFAHGVRADPAAVHVCYCHTPFRYAWHEREAALAGAPRPVRRPLARTLAAIRDWDTRASARVTRYVANSRVTQRRIERFYEREADVVHPPVDIERFQPLASRDVGEHLLLVGELVAHKRPAVALEAARRAGRPIKVVGGGPELRRLRARYGDRAEFLGRVGDAELSRLYAEALAVVVPGVEEFGIVSVESQAAGRPVIALAASGAAECVAHGETGVLLDRADADAFAEAIREVDLRAFDPGTVRANAERFSVPRFQEAFRNAVAQSVDAGSSVGAQPWLGAGQT